MGNVIVTGGSRGIGLGIVRRLAKAGYSVMAVARKESPELRAAIDEAAAAAAAPLASLPTIWPTLTAWLRWSSNSVKTLGPSTRW